MFGKDKPKLFTVTFYTKVGHAITLKVSNIKVNHSKSGEIKSYSWSGADKSLNISINDIEAIVWDN